MEDIVEVKQELAEKSQALEALQRNFDDFQESSRELEEELEAELTRVSDLCDSVDGALILDGVHESIMGRRSVAKLQSGRSCVGFRNTSAGTTTRLYHERQAVPLYAARQQRFVSSGTVGNCRPSEHHGTLNSELYCCGPEAKHGNIGKMKVCEIQSDLSILRVPS